MTDDTAYQIIARGPRLIAEAAVRAVDEDAVLESTTYSILEEDEDHDVWRIDAFPTTEQESAQYQTVLGSFDGLVVTCEKLADADWLAISSPWGRSTWTTVAAAMAGPALRAVMVTVEPPSRAMVAGAAPPAAIIEGAEKIGFDITHVYGLTETYGPASVCAKHPEWDELPIDRRAERNGRQGVRYHMQEAITVLDPVTMEPVPADGETMGEIMFRGNLVMKGYLKNEKATQEAFAGGWFHTGDLAVMYPDGYVKIKDRSKDVIISGGENISSLEVEDVLCRFPDVIAAAVVALPDPKWGEVPCAFVELKPGATATEADLIAHCRTRLAGFKTPKHVVFTELPKTSTGKIQKFELRAVAKLMS